MIRLAVEPPICCSVCGNQDTSKRHVDFDAAIDQGFYGDDLARKRYGDEAAIPVSHEDILVCESCVKEAGNLVGMTDDVNLLAELASLKVRLEAAERDAVKAQQYADRLEDAFEHRAQPIEIDHRRKPRQRTPA